MALSVTYAGNSTATDSTAGESVAGVTWNAGDDIYVIGITADASITFTGVPTATGLVFSALAGSPTTATTACKMYAWKATAAAGGTQTVSATGSANVKVIAVWVASGTAGTGAIAFASVNGTTTTTGNLTLTGSGSVVIWGGGDFNATNDTTVAAVPVGGTQRMATFVTTQDTVFAFDWTGQNAGTTAYGISGFAGGTFSKVAIEILAGATSDAPISQFKRFTKGLYLRSTRRF